MFFLCLFVRENILFCLSLPKKNSSHFRAKQERSLLPGVRANKPACLRTKEKKTGESKTEQNDDHEPTEILKGARAGIKLLFSISTREWAPTGQNRNTNQN